MGWGQIDPSPASKIDPVSKKGPVSAIPEPELACAGTRAELLDYPTAARSLSVGATVVADFTVTPEGKVKEVKLTTSKESADAKPFEDVVRLYLAQSTFPPGCEKAPKQVRFEFFIQGDASPERKTLIEFKTPNAFQISVNPNLQGASNSADRTR